MPTHFAEELTAPEFQALITAETIGVLPVAAIEPHGPHLPLSTDCDIARGHLHALPEFVGEDTSVIILPLQTIGLSPRHTASEGAFAHSAQVLLAVWGDMARAFHAGGGRRLIVVSSHAGNASVVEQFVTQLRVDPGLFAVGADWMDFGQPKGLFGERERAYGVHGGAIETSLMLHYWPETVRNEERADFASAAEAWDRESREMKAHGQISHGWLASDLNPLGAVGDALDSSAEKGAASAQHALMSFSELIADVAAFDLNRLRATR